MQRSPIRTLSILALASLATATSASAQCAYLWPNRENSLINGNDKAAAVVSFYEGGITEYVYVAGTRATVNGSEIVLYKYDRHCGQLQPGFPVTYSGPAGGTNEAVDLIVEGQQGLGTPPTAVYVIGASQGVGTGLDFVTLKFNADGTPHSGWGQVPGQPWAPAAGVRRYNNSLVNGNDHPVAAYFRHTDDGIYVLGTSDGGSGPGGLATITRS